jgi:hypothetical protein
MLVPTRNLNTAKDQKSLAKAVAVPAIQAIKELPIIEGFLPYLSRKT